MAGSRYLLPAAVAVILLAPLAAVAEDVDQLRKQLETSEGTVRLEVLYDLARATARNAPTESMEYAREAIDLAGRLGNDREKVRALNNLGIGHYSLGEYREALSLYTESLPLAEKIGFEEGIANSLNNTGVIYYVWGEYDRAIEYYTRALELRKKNGDREGEAKGYNNLGIVYYATGLYSQSLRYLEQSQTIYLELGNDGLAANTLNNIGLVHFRMERMDEALAQFRESLRISESLDDKPTVALSLNHIGMVFDARERHEQSLVYYRRSLDVREEIGDRQGVAVCLHNIGFIHAQTGDHLRAMEDLEKALAIAKELSLKELERDIHLAISITQEWMGNHEKSLESFKKHKEVNDSLLDQQTTRRLTEMEARYEVESKDQEIELLRKSQQIQTIVRNFILGAAVLLLLVIFLLWNSHRLKERANAEREKSARAELAHVARVATMGELTTALAHELNQPLTSILSNTQASRRLLASGGIEQAELDDILGDIVDGADRAREIIRKLRRLIRRGDITVEKLDINETLRDVERFARVDAQEKGIGLSMELSDGLPQITGDRIQLQQVLLNLVRNGAETMMHDTASDRRLVVRSDEDDQGRVVVSVRDSGPPLEEGMLERIFDPFFTTKADGLGMGLPICRGIIEAHGGKLTAVANPTGGLTISFTLPRA